MRAESLYAQGHAHYEREQFTPAADCFRECCIADPKEPNFWAALGTALLKAESFQEAYTALDMATFLKADPALSLHAAECLLSLGQVDRAMQILTTAKQSTDDGNPLKGRIAVLQTQWGA